MNSRIAAALVAAVALVILGLWALQSRSGTAADPTDSNPGSVSAADRGATARDGRAASAAAGQGTYVSTEGLATLDCAKPQGDVARVNGSSITAASLCKELTALTGSGAQAAPARTGEQARALLDQLIDAALIEEALAESGASVSRNELDAELEKLRPSGAPGPIAEVLSSQGIQVDAVRAQLERRVALRKLVETRGNIAVTDAEVTEEYERNPDRWRAGGAATIEPYIIRLAPGASAEQEAAAQQKAKNFGDAVASGVAPAQAASTAGMSALAPFELQMGSSERELEAAVFPLREAAWSAPVRTRAGWVVARVQSRKEAVPRSLAQAREDVRTFLEGQRRASEQRRLLSELRARARIEVLVQFHALG